MIDRSLLWDSDLEADVMVSITIAVDSRDPLPSEPDLLVGLDTSRDLWEEGEDPHAVISYLSTHH